MPALDGGWLGGEPPCRAEATDRGRRRYQLGASRSAATAATRGLPQRLRALAIDDIGRWSRLSSAQDMHVVADVVDDERLVAIACVAADCRRACSSPSSVCPAAPSNPESAGSVPAASESQPSAGCLFAAAASGETETASRASRTVTLIATPDAKSPNPEIPKSPDLFARHHEIWFLDHAASRARIE